VSVIFKTDNPVEVYLSDTIKKPSKRMAKLVLTKSGKYAPFNQDNKVVISK
jgi:hypothetical protein